MNTYEIVDLDVWGNTDDGYTVNDVYKTGEFISFDSEALTSYEIVELLVKEGFLEAKALTLDICVSGETDGILFVDIDDEPVYQLHAVISD